MAETESSVLGLEDLVVGLMMSRSECRFTGRAKEKFARGVLSMPALEGECGLLQVARAFSAHMCSCSPAAHLSGAGIGSLWPYLLNALTSRLGALCRLEPGQDFPRFPTYRAYPGHHGQLAPFHCPHSGGFLGLASSVNASIPSFSGTINLPWAFLDRALSAREHK